MIIEEEKTEQKGSDIEAQPLTTTPMTPARQLRYVHTFEPKALATQLERLNKKYQETLTPNTLDEQLANLLENEWFYWLYNKLNHGLLWVANYGSNGLFFIFPIKTGGTGVLNLIRFFNPTIQTLPSFVSPIVAVIAGLDICGYMMVFSPRDCALMTTYDLFQFRKKSLVEHCSELAATSPSNAAKNIINQTILWVTNILGSTTEVVFYLPLIESSINKWLLTAVAAYFCNLYYKYYMDDDYYEGQAALFDRSQKYFFQEGNVFTTFQIIAQAAAAIALRIVYYDFIIEEMYPALEIPPNPVLTNFLLLCVGLHSFCIYFNSTKNHYLSAKKCLENKLPASAEIKHFLASLTGTPAENKLAVENKILHIIANQEKELRANGGCAYIFKKEAVTTLFFLLRAGFATYAGIGIADLFLAGTPKTIAAIFIAPATALLLTAPLIPTEAPRIAHNELLERVVAEEKPAGAHPRIKNPASLIIGIILTACTAIALNLSTIGTISSPEDKPRLLLAGFLLVALERMLSSIFYNYPKVQQTVASQLKSSPRVTSCLATLFCQRKKRRLSPPEQARLNTTLHPH